MLFVMSTSTLTFAEYTSCDQLPCANGGICTPIGNTYRCSCVAGYQGTNCEENIDECASNPCQYGGTCIDGVSKCTCGLDFSGLHCEKGRNVNLTQLGFERFDQWCISK